MSAPATSISTDDPAAAPSGAMRSSRDEGSSAREVELRSRSARRETERIETADLLRGVLVNPTDTTTLADHRWELLDASCSVACWAGRRARRPCGNVTLKNGIPL